MNIFNVLIVKISHIIAAIVLFVGLSGPAQPQTTEIDIPGFTPIATASPTQEPVNNAMPVVPAGAVPTETPTPVSIPIPTPTPNVPIIIVQLPTPVPVIVTPTPTPMTEATPVPQPAYTLQVVSPLAGKGLNRTYSARSEIYDEKNYIELGLIVTDQQGNVVNNVQVDVTATDATQNKQMGSTGNVTKIYPDGNEKQVYYYPFHYEFHTPGDHTITFTVAGITKAVTVSAPEDTRPTQ